MSRHRFFITIGALTYLGKISVALTFYIPTSQPIALTSHGLIIGPHSLKLVDSQLMGTYSLIFTNTLIYSLCGLTISFDLLPFKILFFTLLYRLLWLSINWIALTLNYKLLQIAFPINIITSALSCLLNAAFNFSKQATYKKAILS